MAAMRPNVMIRRSVFGYSILDQQYGFSGILHNLAGFMCFLIVKGNPRDRWSGTKVSSSGGEIKQPQSVSSWLMGDLLNCLRESSEQLDGMSETQDEKVRDAVSKNLSAPALRFWDMDRRFEVSE